jgi:hypothetical protein
MQVQSDPQRASPTHEVTSFSDTSVSSRAELKRHIFVLGEECTGMTSLHRYFLAYGVKSVNHFPSFSRPSLSINYGDFENRQKFLEIVLTSDCEAFLNYPTRQFFEPLYHAYPDAFFILTTRSSTDLWLESVKYSSSLSFINDVDERQLVNSYETLNQTIRSFFINSDRKFLELCTDDDIKINSDTLAEFIGFSKGLLIERDVDQSTEPSLSFQHSFYNSPEEDPIVSIENRSSPYKGAISEYGWSYLVNDTNNFLRVQFGYLSWSNDQRRAAVKTLENRVAQLKEKHIGYRLFVVPEKSVVYRDYLPRRLADLKEVVGRPARLLQESVPAVVHYPEVYLRDARSFGQLYFRGDTHTNWTGAWFLYRFVIRQLLADRLLSNACPISFSELLPSIATYDGDLWTQLNEPVKQEFNRFWGFTNAQFGLEISIKLDLPSEKSLAQRVKTPDVYQQWFSERETIVYERPDGVGPTVVIFRDSTVELCHHLLAQHFSRSVFIWHQGAVYGDVIELERPDLVLHFVAERFITRYPTMSPIDTVRSPHTGS